ncbi:MAG: citrate transporter [Treponema sp.]|nr:citrate transporter [Treponema sp.]
MKSFWPFGAAVRFIKREPVLFAALLLAICASAITRPQPSLYIQAIDFRTLAILFCLMITIKAFQSQNFLDYAAACLLRLCKDRRSLYLLLAALVFFSSMLVTNDVALLTFVPITLLIFRRLGLSPLKIVVLETLAANLGSCATPMGNPQNLYLFSRYNFSAADFFMQTAKIALPSIFILSAMIVFITKKSPDQPHNFMDATLQQQRVIVKTGPKTFVYAAEFAVCLLTVFRALPWPAMLAFVAAASLLCDAGLFKKVDYSLLFTFAGFFIFTKTISTVPAFSDFMQTALSSRLSTYIAGIAASQVISNVPAALLLSGFTQDGAALLLAVNAGGLGTLIASMASVISFKLYSTSEEAKAPGAPNFMAIFTAYNLLLLAILAPLAFIL